MLGYASAFQGMTLTPPTPMMRMSTPTRVHRQQPEQRRGRYCSILVVGFLQHQHNQAQLTCVRVFKHLANGYRYPTCRSISELAVDAAAVALVHAGIVDDAFWSRVHALTGAMDDALRPRVHAIFGALLAV
jgi:hypothetical protein